MILRPAKMFYGWYVVIGSSLVFFGVAGSQFSFGVFLKPMTEEFDWSRTTLSLAFGTTFMLSGLLRPIAGYLADRYNPKTVALAGVVVTGAMLMLLPLIGNLVHLYLIFAMMSIGITLGTGAFPDQNRQRMVLSQPGGDSQLAQRRGFRRRNYPGACRVFLPNRVQLAGGLPVPGDSAAVPDITPGLFPD